MNKIVDFDKASFALAWTLVFSGSYVEDKGWRSHSLGCRLFLSLE